MSLNPMKRQNTEVPTTAVIQLTKFKTSSVGLKIQLGPQHQENVRLLGPNLPGPAADRFSSSVASVTKAELSQLMSNRPPAPGTALGPVFLCCLVLRF